MIRYLISNIEDLEMSENSSFSYSSISSSQSNMNVDEKLNTKFSKLEKRWIKFIELHDQISKFSNPSKIYQSRKLSWL